MQDRLAQMQALERSRYRLVELERYAYAAGIDCPDTVLEELVATRQLIATLEVAAVSPPTAAQVLSRMTQPELPQQIVWPQDGKAMVLVPAGSFMFGSDSSSRGNERPAHEVVLPAYYIDRTPVTVGEYARFLAATGGSWPRLFPTHWQPFGYEHYPVTGVSWHEAHAYATWAGKRLPSEPEWEKAASWDWASGTRRRYPWGDEWDARRCNIADSGPGHVTPVGAYSPHGDAPCGAVDMAGNVFEWTSSLDWNYPYRPGDGRDDPGRYGVRVRRGGAYTSNELFVRTTTRQNSEPDGFFLTDGFRCVADVPG
ncbi:MAG: formylglycine-generating enzyme family protein [Chloroflexaceae bacterium]|jgi:formylglycine-generating enzyme required for sulfatase activity|nr:formylglycine-generating enzyme family protein [Chloroflexaceae bacterium]